MRQVRKVTTVVLVSLFSFVAPSCSDDDSMTEFAQETPDLTVSEEVKQQLTALGFDVSDVSVKLEDNVLSPAFEEVQYIVEGDIAISQSELELMINSEVFHTGAVGEQYRTTNLVSNNRIIKVLGFTGIGNALDSRMRSALQMAIANYNSLDIGLRFTLHFGSNTTGYDITVMKTDGSAGGSAGFPTSGNPYRWVKINAGTSAYGVDVVEHVITHELGHSLGLRHTDYFNRSLSCGYGGNEGSAGVGAIRVPGTPSGFDPTSVMLSCFNASATGEFGIYDKKALQYLY